MKAKVLAEPALVGRERELEELQHHFDLAVQGKGTTVFVSGEAGGGKTRLANEFLFASKQKRDTAQLAGWCLSNSGIPYFPFIEAFNAYFSGFGKKSDSNTSVQASLEKEELGLKSWLMGPRKSEKSRELENLSPQAWKDSTFAAVTKALLSVSAKKPTILFIDDLQWADTASLALLQYISRFINSERVLVLGTFRSEDLTPDNEGRPHPLVDALRLMGRENLFREIKLPSLSRPDASLLAENMVGGRVQTELAEKLADESQGNPLFIIESLKMLRERGSLVQEKDRWRLSTDEIGIPTKIKDIIMRRVDALKPNQRKMLDLASVIGSKFSPELLGAAAAQDSLETLETLSAIEKSTSLVVCEGSNYRFDHAKVRDALYEEIAPPLRKAYHGRVAERIESNCKGEKLPVGDLAFHYSQAENKEKTVKYALAAGEEALKIFSGSEAIKHFRCVLDVTAEDMKYADERTTALEGLGDGLFANARCGEAVKVFEQLSSSTTSDLVRMRALRKALNVCAWGGDYSHALEIANKTVEDPQLDRLENARVRLCKGAVKDWGGESKQALEDMEESLRVFEEEYSLPDMPDMLAAIGATLLDLKLENAIAAELRSCAFGEYAKDLNSEHYPRNYLCYVFLACGLQKEAQETVAESFKISEKISDPISRAWAQNFDYWCSGYLLEAKAVAKLFSSLPIGSMRDFGKGAKIKFFMSSLISGALREFKQALKAAVVQSLKGTEFAEETDSYSARANSCANLARQYAELGDMEQAEKYYKKMTKIYDETGLAGVLWLYAFFLFSKAVFLSSKSQWKEANQCYEEAIETYRKEGPPNALTAWVRQSYCWSLLQQGRFADSEMQFEKAREIMDSLENRFVHSNVLGYFMAPVRVDVDKEFNMRLDLINVAKNPGVLVRVEGLAPADFKVTAIQPNYNMQKGIIELENKNIKPFTDEAITFTVQATKAGVFNLNPQLVYVDDLGETRTCTPKPITITVKPAQPQFEVIPGRVPTGFAELDALLLGGIPEHFAVALTSPSTDEREMIIKRFLETGAIAGETTFHIAAEAAKTKALAEEHPSNFHLFLCNPQADAMIQSVPNVFKLKGVENLTDIDIALTKAFRTLNPSAKGPRRICIEIVSDVLLQHHAATTRRWLSALLPTLKSKGFTVLAVMDPHMHPSEEVLAILGVFDGEIRIIERETPEGTRQMLKIRKLYNQKYLEKEIVLTKERLSG